jgi:4a-hydroxytetrahydrobiopterin dehydratase
MAELLPDEEIESRLGALEGWEREGDAITKTFERGDFVGSVEFVRSLVEPAEGMNHHPDLELSWDKVKVSITNHAAGGLTPADFELAGKIDALA